MNAETGEGTWYMFKYKLIIYSWTELLLLYHW